jgi:hypothetical protein
MRAGCGYEFELFPWRVPSAPSEPYVSVVMVMWNEEQMFRTHPGRQLYQLFGWTEGRLQQMRLVTPMSRLITEEVERTRRARRPEDGAELTTSWCCSSPPISVGSGWAADWEQE